MQCYVLISSDHDSGFEGSKDIQCVHSKEDIHIELEQPVEEEQCRRLESEEKLIQQQDIEFAINDEVSGAMRSFLMIRIIDDIILCQLIRILLKFNMNHFTRRF